MLLLAVGISLTGGCALQVKVREEWDVDRNQPIPLSEAREVWADIRSGRSPSEEELEVYNNAIRNSVVQIGRNWSSGATSLARIETTGGEVDLAVNAVNIRGMDLIDEVTPAHFIDVKRGFDDHEDEEDHVHIAGVGEPLMVRQRWSEGDSMIPSTGLWYPVTGVLNLDQPNRPMLELIDPTRQASLSFAGTRFPLSVDYTATFARDFHDSQRLFSKVPAFFQFEKFAERMGIYRVSPFDPNKQACVLVHGINSSPVTWHLFLNQAYEDADIRERYEFWTFGYPTGAPIPYLAEEFRESLRNLVAFREANRATDLDLVVVGHSMGGLLAKAATQTGGDEDWNKLFNVPIDELEVPEKDRETLRKMIYNQPIPEVKRVVFCATPHRGSKLAAKPGLKLVGELVEVPKQLAVLTTEIVKRSSHALTPLGLEFAKEPSSVDQLRPGSLVTTEFLNRPLNPNVKFHSVIGRRRPGTPLERASDSVVNYTSAHIEGVVSEKIVDESKHGVHRVPDGIDEIIRILKLP